MVKKGRINDFLLRWNLKLPEERLFNEFRVRVCKCVELFREDVEWAASRGGLKNLLHLLEHQFAFINAHYYAERGVDFKSRPPQNMLVFCKDSGSFPQLILILQRIFYAVEEYCESRPEEVEAILEGCTQRLVHELNEALEHSPGIDLRLVREGIRVELVPAGVALLDIKVDEAIAWLQKYPDVASEFRNALEIAALKTEDNYRSALDNLRVAMEKLLNIVLKNKLSLGDQVKPLGQWMSHKGAHAQIRNNYTTMLKQFAEYQDKSVKHPVDKSTWTPAELEYMIYLTATLMRFILELE